MAAQPGQIDEPEDVDRVEQQQPGIDGPLGGVAAAQHQHRQKHEVKQDHQHQPGQQRQAGGLRLLPRQRADQAGERDEARAQQRGAGHEGEDVAEDREGAGLRRCRLDHTHRQAEAHQDGESEDRAVPQKLAGCEFQPR